MPSPELMPACLRSSIIFLSIDLDMAYDSLEGKLLHSRLINLFMLENRMPALNWIHCRRLEEEGGLGPGVMPPLVHCRDEKVS